MKTLLLVSTLVLLTETFAKNFAIPASRTACKKAITFPITAQAGVTGYPWKMEVFGIPVLATDTFKKSGKMNHAASILAGLLDQDNDGCADDPNVLNAILKKSTDENFPGKKLQQALVLTNEFGEPQWPEETSGNYGYLKGQGLSVTETEPKYAGLKARYHAESQTALFDVAQEEILHFINSMGHVKAYPKLFGSDYTSNSALTKAMDIARGKKLMKTPADKSGYPSSAWYKYTDESCGYGCQAIEYLWWGYAAYSGIGNNLYKGAKNEEFKYIKKQDFITKDTGLAKLFKDSEDKKSSYRLPTKPITGVYTGCGKCANGGKSHGGK